MDDGDACDVEAVFGKADVEPGRYQVTVSREDDNWYQVFGTDYFLQTSLCLNLALGDEAVLSLAAGGYGSIYFLDDEEECTVEAVFAEMNL